MVAIEIFICCLVAYDFVLSDDTFYERLWATKEFLLMIISHQQLYMEKEIIKQPQHHDQECRT